MADSKKTNNPQGFHLVHRYIWLVETIQRFNGVSFKQIEDCWRSSEINTDSEAFPLKSFHNHKNALEQLFGITIICQRKGGYRYYIGQDASPIISQIKQALLQSLTINQMTEMNHALRQRISLESIPGNLALIPAILTSIAQGHGMQMTYRAYNSDEEKSYEVEPYGIKLFRQRWYIVARYAKYDSIITYALERVQALIPTETSYAIPDDFQLEAHFSESYGIMCNEEPEEVIIKVYHAAKKHMYLRDLPLHHSQQFISVEEDYSIMSYALRCTYDFQQEILSHGTDIEVIKPQHLREAIRDIYRLQLTRYESENSELSEAEPHPL